MLAISICKLDLEFQENWFIHHTTAMLNEPRIRSLRLKKSIGLSGSRITLAMEREKKDALHDWKLRKKARTPFLKPRRSEEYTWQVNTWPILDNPINAGCIWAKARTRIITLRLGYKRPKTNAAIRGMFYYIALKTRLSETLLLFVVTCSVAIDVSSDSDECCCCDESPETDGDIAEPSVISGFGDGLVAAIATSIFCAKRGNVDTMYSLNFDNGDMSADDSFVTIHIIVDHLGLVKLSDDCWRPTLGVWRRCAGACGYAMRIVDAS